MRQITSCWCYGICAVTTNALGPVVNVFRGRHLTYQTLENVLVHQAAESSDTPSR